MADTTTLTVEIDGTTLTDADLEPLVEVQAEEAADTADAVTLMARVEAGADGEWTSLLDPLTSPRTPVVVGLTRGGANYRFDGRSTEADWDLDAAGASQLTVKAIDRSLDMDAIEKVTAWPGTSDSGIAEAIFATYGFGTKVDATPDGPDPDVHVVLQRGTDWAFVRALARKWGYDAYLEAEGASVVGHFHAIDPLADPEVELALGFGGDAERVSVQAHLTAGHRVQAARIPALSDTAQQAEAGGDDQVQGLSPLGGMATVLLTPTDVDGEVEPEKAATGLARQSAFVVTLTAEIDTDRTGLLLRARRTVLVKGLGSTLSGRWLIRRVRHRVTLVSHVQELTLVRNALGLKGDEPFGGSALGGLL
jgi:hypothetical protein